MGEGGEQQGGYLDVWCQTDDGVFVKLSCEGGEFLLMVELLTREAAEAIDAQIKATSSLLMPLRARAPLNTTLAVCLQIPAAGTEHWMAGRVVLSSPRGLGLEVQATSPATFALRWGAAVSSLMPGMRTPMELRDHPRTASPLSPSGPQPLSEGPRRRVLKGFGSASSFPARGGPGLPVKAVETPSSRPRPPAPPPSE